MKKIFSNLVVIIILTLITGCQDRSNISSPSPQSGSADFTRFVTIGNSITAGYQSSALYQDAQKYAYGNLIAHQVNTSFAIPFISNPGLGGQLYVHSFSSTGADIRQLPSTGVPLNLNYPAPYNNLGVPGAMVYDILKAKDSLTCFSNNFGQPNPFFNLILRGIGTQFEQAKALHPTFVTCWIGNNDVLGYATNGGVPSVLLTSATTFDVLYSQLGDSLASLGAKVVIANIPDVTTIPFFSTIGPIFSASAPWAYFKSKGLPGFCYGNHEGGVTGVADSLSLATLKVLITLKGQDALSFIGDTTGAYYTVNQITVPIGVNIHYPFGLVPYNPFPDQYVLDPTEIKTASDAVSAFNSTILKVANTKGFGLVDINSIFKNIFLASISSGGGMYYGAELSTMFISGGLFSLDGVHPTSRGQGLIANEFLKVINSKFGSNFPLLNLGNMPGSITLGKRNFPGMFQFNIYDWRNFNL
jgi:lysophospholipase L1-like esterase